MHYKPGVGWIGSNTNISISNQVLVTAGILGLSVAGAAYYLYITTSTRSNKSSTVNMSGIAGLHNLGNTCYVNSLLQGLASVPSLARWLLEIELDEDMHGGLLYEMKKLFSDLNNSANSTVCNAGGVNSALALHRWNVTIGVEHDLHELLNVFVETWEDEVRIIKQKIIALSALDSISEVSRPNESPSILNKRRKDLVLKRCSDIVKLDSKLRLPCFGFIATQLRCCEPTCLFKKVRYDVFGAISLSIPKMALGGRVTVECLLRTFFCGEVIRGACCDKCKKNNGKCDSGLLKKQGFSKLPQCLIIRVERVGVLPSGQNFKHSDHVEFGETLDVRDFCFYKNKEDEYNRCMTRHANAEFRLPDHTSRIVGGNEVNEKLIGHHASDTGLANKYGMINGGSFVAERKEAARYRYQLRAVSEHRGLPETGHFITYRRGVTDPHAWYLTNDASVSRVSYSQVASAQAYMLYYERIQPSRWYKGSSSVPLTDLFQSSL